MTGYEFQWLTGYEFQWLTGYKFQWLTGYEFQWLTGYAAAVLNHGHVVLTFLSCFHFLRSDPVIGDETAGTVALSVLALEILVFISTDLLLLDRYSRYTLTPYIVVVVALTGSIAKNWEDGATNSILTAVLLGVGAAGLVLKVVMLIYRHATRKPYTMHMAPTLNNYKGGQLA